MDDWMVPVVFFLTVYGIFHLFVRRKERLALIEKGVDAKIFDREGALPPSLKYGLFLIGIALGFIVGYCLYEYASIDREVAYPASIFFFGGVGLLVYYFMGKNTKENQ